MRLFLVFFFSLCLSIGWTQTALQTLPNGKLTIYSASFVSGITWNISGTFLDETGKYISANFLVGDIIYAASGAEVRKFVITVMNNNTGGTINCVANVVGTNPPGSILGVGAIVRGIGGGKLGSLGASIPEKIRIAILNDVIIQLNGLSGVNIGNTDLTLSSDRTLSGPFFLNLDPSLLSFYSKYGWVDQTPGARYRIHGWRDGVPEFTELLDNRKDTTILKNSGGNSTLEELVGPDFASRFRSINIVVELSLGLAIFLDDPIEDYLDCSIKITSRQPTPYGIFLISSSNLMQGLGNTQTNSFRIRSGQTAELRCIKGTSILLWNVSGSELFKGLESEDINIVSGTRTLKFDALANDVDVSYTLDIASSNQTGVDGYALRGLKISDPDDNLKLYLEQGYGVVEADEWLVLKSPKRVYTDGVLIRNFTNPNTGTSFNITNQYSRVHVSGSTITTVSLPQIVNIQTVDTHVPQDFEFQLTVISSISTTFNCGGDDGIYFEGSGTKVFSFVVPANTARTYTFTAVNLNTWIVK